MLPIFKFIAVFLLALAAGLGSAWYMIDAGAAFTTGRIGPWAVWYSAGNPTADPYTKAHFARTGRLPITSTSALYYSARSDRPSVAAPRTRWPIRRPRAVWSV